LASAIPARLSPAEGRKFGWTVGGAFLVLGALLWWRGKPAAPVFGALGALLALAAAVIPSRLGPIQRGWMALAHLISRFTTPLFMGIVYFGVLTPVGMIKRAFGSNPMASRAQGGSYWVARRDDMTQRSMERQF